MPQTDTQRQAALTDAGYDTAGQAAVAAGTPTAIPVAPLTTAPPTPLNVTQPGIVSPYSVKGLNTDINTPPLTPTATEGDASSLMKELQSLNDENTGQSAYRTGQENAQGLPALLKTQTDLSARLTAIKNEADAIPLQLQEDATGRGITAAGLAPIQASALRKNAIQALSVSSLLEASKGNITLANDMVDRAVAQKYDPIKEEINAKTANLNLILNSPEYTLEQKNRAQAQLDIQTNEKTTIEKAQQNEKDILTIATDAAKNGANAETLKAIAESKTPTEALQAAGGFSAKPVVQEGNFVYTTQDLKEDKAILNSTTTTDAQGNPNRGPDGYSNPAIYKQLFVQWTQAGGSPASFLKQFPLKDYINPKNTDADIIALRNFGKAIPKTSTKKTGTSTAATSTSSSSSSNLYNAL